MGLLVLLDTGVLFLPQTQSWATAQEGVHVVVWFDIAGVAVKKKLVGHEITVSTRSLGLLTSRVTSPTLGAAIQTAWRRS